MKILESSENYLEAILVIQNRKGSVRAVDIANELSVTKASVSVAMKHLKENGYIEVNSDNNIKLLESGKLIAEEMYERHVFLTNALVKMGVSEGVAEIDACKIEHVLSRETFIALKNYFKDKD